MCILNNLPVIFSFYGTQYYILFAYFIRLMCYTHFRRYTNFRKSLTSLLLLWDLINFLVALRHQKFPLSSGP